MAKYPITRIKAAGFGPFADIDLALSPSLNVITGDNATGKSQLLKLLYVCTRELAGSGKETGKELTKTELNRDVASALVGAFRSDKLGRLTSRKRGTSKATSKAVVAVEYEGLARPLGFSFSSRSTKEVDCNEVPDRRVEDTPVFFPSRELLSLYPGLVSLYASREVEFDETWRDTAVQLGKPALKGPRSELAHGVLGPVFDLIEGSVVEENGRFYVHLRDSSGGGSEKLEAHLVSEGYRKLAMLIRLVSNGVLLEGGYLFWDEPEGNLNPATQRALAKAIVQLASSGTQVFVATHSTYLLREFEMMLDPEEGENNPLHNRLPRYLGLYRGEDGVSGESVLEVNELSSIRAAEVESEQSWQYLGA